MKYFLFLLPTLIFAEWKEIPKKEFDQNIRPSTFVQLTGKFKQTKVSTLFHSPQVQWGKFEFTKKGNRLRWMYTQPTSYGIFFSEKEKYFFNAKGEKRSLDSQAITRYIESFILRGISQRAFEASKDFNQLYLKKQRAYQLVLRPLNRRMSRVIREIHFLFEDSPHPKKVTLLEKGGDSLVIEFFKIKEE